MAANSGYRINFEAFVALLNSLLADIPYQHAITEEITAPTPNNMAMNRVLANHIPTNDPTASQQGKSAGAKLSHSRISRDFM